MRKILFILPGFTFGGTVFSTLNMISLLDKSKYDITILAMTHQGPIKENFNKFNVWKEDIILSSLMGNYEKETKVGRKIVFALIKILRRLLEPYNIPFTSFILKKKAKKIQNSYHFDVVASCQEGGATEFASYFDKSKRIAWFRSEYSIYKDGLRPWDYEKEKIIYPKFDIIVCVSKVTRNDFCIYFDNLKDRVVAIHNIQNVDKIKIASKQMIQDSFSNLQFNIVSVGRIAPQKRFHLIPLLANKMKRAGVNFKWYIIGDGNMGGANDLLKQSIKEYDVAREVICMGSRLNVYPYIASADLLVSTSLYEACPRVVIEAKILKIPVICSDFSSAREFVSNDFDGYVDAVDFLDKRIIRMITDQNYYNMIKENCNKYIMDNEMIEKQLQKIFN